MVHSLNDKQTDNAILFQDVRNKYILLGKKALLCAAYINICITNQRKSSTWHPRHPPASTDIWCIFHPCQAPHHPDTSSGPVVFSAQKTTQEQTHFNYWSVQCLCHRGLWVSSGRIKKSLWIILPRKKYTSRWKWLNYSCSLKMYQIILHSEYLGHIWHRRFFKFIPRTYLQTARWVIQRLELWTLQPCLTNLATEISLTFELQWQTWPSFHSRLCSLILSTCCCLSLSLSFASSVLPLYRTTSKRYI